MYNNRLTVNASKTKVMTFGTSPKIRRDNNPTFKIKEDVLEIVTQFKTKIYAGYRIKAVK